MLRVLLGVTKYTMCLAFSSATKSKDTKFEVPIGLVCNVQMQEMLVIG